MLHERYPTVPRIALTATVDELTRHEIVHRLGLNEASRFVASFNRPNIRYTVIERDNPRKQLLGFLATHRGEAGNGEAKAERYGNALLRVMDEAASGHKRLLAGI